jgi:carboxyl-terminal processing protease
MSTRNRPTRLLPIVLLGASLLGLGLSHAWAQSDADEDAAPDPALVAQLQRAVRAHGGGTLPAHDVQLFAEVLQRVRDSYVSPVNDHALMQAAIRGMVESLDTHSTFLSDDEYQDMQVTTSGAYAGIGVEVAPGHAGVVVLRRMPGSPAERAGIRAGDVIVRIDGTSVDPTNVDAAIERMRGLRGSLIRLAIERTGSATPLQFAVRRAEVKLVSVEGELLMSDYGYVRITSFTDGTAGELEGLVQRLEQAAPRHLTGLVLDLRNNPGGVLDSAVRIADDFLERGTIVSARGRTDEANFHIAATPGDITHGARLIVVVNGGSASAAEILAAALHDNHRATLIGRRSYGKGTVQTIMPMPYGTALKITTSRYYTPAGICINGVGIQPDVLLTGPEQPPGDMDVAQNDPQVVAALGLLGQGGAPLLGGRRSGAPATPAGPVAASAPLAATAAPPRAARFQAGTAR